MHSVTVTMERYYNSYAIYRMLPFPTTHSDLYPRFQDHGVTIDAVDILCAQLTRDLFAIAKFLVSDLFAKQIRKRYRNSHATLLILLLSNNSDDHSAFVNN